MFSNENKFRCCFLFGLHLQKKNETSHNCVAENLFILLKMTEGQAMTMCEG